MSTNRSIFTLLLTANLRRCILLLVLAFAPAISAQNVLSGAQTGTIEGMHQGDRYLTISGRDYGYHSDVTQVFYDGEQVRSSFLNEGLVVRFVTNREGVITRIEVLGPLNLIEALEES